MAEWNSANLVIAKGHVFKKPAFPELTLPDPSQVYIYYHCSVLQMQIHVSS